jgi:8-oxo-dGTP diphosphatase
MQVAYMSPDDKARRPPARAGRPSRTAHRTAEQPPAPTSDRAHPPVEVDWDGSAKARSEREEAAFLASYDPEAFDRPSVAVDVVVLTVVSRRLQVVVYRRKEHPAKGLHALPGGFVRIDESLDHAAARLLREKAGLRGVFVEQLYTFGAPGRDPRMRIIAVAYYALVDHRRLSAVAKGLGARLALVTVAWSGETGGPVSVADHSHAALPLAFDHADIVGMAVKRIRGRLDYSPIGFQLLPAEFTLRELQDVHEAVRDEPVNKDSFRRRMLAGGLLEATGERERDVLHRPAELYRFVKRSAV